jgi:putative inorganic carbon (HCO3(-)) transporter
MLDWLNEKDAPTVGRVLFWAFLAIVAWAPLPLGSNRGWAWGLLTAAIFLLCAAWIIARACDKVPMPEPLKRAWPVLALLVAWIGYQMLHIIPMPQSWVAAISPDAGAAFAAVRAYNPDGYATLSVDPYASKGALLKSLAWAGVFFLTLALASSRKRVKLLAYVIVFAAVAQSIYAILMHLGGATTEYFGAVIFHGASASGTYVNRNHLAGFLEMSLAVGIGLLIASLRETGSRSWREFFRRSLELVFSSKIRLRLYLCIMVIALVTTHSRMGNTAFFSSLAIAGVIGLALSRHATRGTVVLLASLIVIDLLIVGSWFGVEKLAARIEQTTAQDVKEREEPAAYAMKQIEDYGWVGSGMGTFYVVFPRYRAENVAYFFDHAHNDYAQFAAEGGYIGIGILGLFVALSLAAALLAQARRRDPLMRGMSFASIMGVAAILIHSTVDFNLQIPANALLFMVLLALAWISLYLERRSPPEEK